MTNDKQAISIADLFKHNKEIQANYDKNRIKMTMAEIVDRPLYLKGYEEVKEKSMAGKEELFCLMHFILADNNDDIVRYVKTQSKAIWDNLKAIPKETYDTNNILAFVKVAPMNNGGKRFYFDGRE